MPFADHGGLVATPSELSRDVRSVKLVFRMEGHHAIDMVVRASQNGCSRWCAGAVGDITVIEAHSLVSDVVEIRRLVESGSRGFCIRGHVGLQRHQMQTTVRS